RAQLSHLDRHTARADVIFPAIATIYFGIENRSRYPNSLSVDPWAPVVRLLLGGRPVAIFGTVRPVVVDAVEAVLGRWPRPYISPARIAVLEPAFANGNAPATVICPISGVGIGAALDHAQPRWVGRGPGVFRLGSHRRNAPGSPLK